MVVRAGLALLALCCVVTQADARKHRATAPAQRLSPIDATRTAVRVDEATRLAQWRAARWTLAGVAPEYDDAGDQGVQVRWRLNKVKLSAPLNLRLD